MSRKSDRPLFNLSIPEHKRMLINYIKHLDGLHHVDIHPARDPHTDPQRRYYRGVVTHAVAQGLREAWGERVDPDGAHDFLRGKFLRRAIADGNGEVVDYRILSTTELDKSQFSGYLDEVIRFAAEHLSVEVPPPAHYESEAVA